jgi:hypothetical protein
MSFNDLAKTMLKKEIFKDDHKVYTGEFRHFLTERVSSDLRDRFCKSVSQKYSGSSPSTELFNKWMHSMCFDGDRFSTPGDFKLVQTAINKAK